MFNTLILVDFVAQKPVYIVNVLLSILILILKIVIILFFKITKN